MESRQWEPARRCVPVIALVASLATPLGAQERISLRASLGVKTGALEAALGAWWPVVRVSSRLQLGLGARLSAFGGDPRSYANRGTVQGALTSGVTVDPAVYAFNAVVFGNLQVARRLALGANLDLVGIAAGPERTSRALRAKPQTFSYFRYASADHGSLNSQFFLSLRVAPTVGIRAGVSHYVTDYIVTDAAAAGTPSSRYQKFDTVPFVGVGLQLSHD